MSALSAFLHPAVPTEEKELVISKRFLGADGKPVPFKIRALTQEENSSLLKASTRKEKGRPAVAGRDGCQTNIPAA